ncbi:MULTISPECIES: type II toxin-antitoxin system VapC family toxin [unclassified Frankia]|uniref:type II toxin-antitoxin system VapC family toxin n=1 Tax=unclassified Frankia TaxID=2632575 RepID=UPI001EF4D884|nr:MULTISPECIES: type II toxin-antitoxin system VapC family toxin [unclassified Frankia]
MSYLLDTNVLSETRKRRRDPGVTEWISLTPSGHMYLSTLTIGEIEQGITQLSQRGDHRQAAIVEDWLSDVIQEFGERIVPVTTPITRQWGRQRRIHPVPTIDALIAATAGVHGWTVVTRNTKDFEYTDVRVFNPFTG